MLRNLSFSVGHDGFQVLAQGERPKRGIDVNLRTSGVTRINVIVEPIPEAAAEKGE